MIYMKKKIGIITMFYKSHNYGGLLQAYALPRFIRKMGFYSEQIQVDFTAKILQNQKKVRKITIKKVLKYLYRKLMVFYYKCYGFHQEATEGIKKRNVLVDKFADFVPHSEVIFNKENINSCTKYYDVFITGSDQVWNLDWYESEYFLDFVQPGGCKLSYAASMPNVEITENQQETIRKHLQDFQGVSVREQKTARYLSNLLGREVECVLDPTLLLGQEEWDEICSERKVTDKYIFCYFLGTDKEMRHETKIFAKKLGLKIVTLPHLTKVTNSDFKFADYNVYEASPGDFISLIKHAEYVITDSFHACVFANIYSVKYFVFSRKGIGEMDERVITLLDIFNSEKRFCKEEKDYMYNLRNLPANKDFTKLKVMQEKSRKFLLNNLEKVGLERINEN